MKSGAVALLLLAAVAAVFAGNPPPAPEVGGCVVGLYRFDDATNLGRDFGPRGNNLTASGTINSDTVNVAVGTGALSLAGNGFLNGGSGVVGVPTGLNEYTIATWFRSGVFPWADIAVGGWGIRGVSNAANWLRTLSSNSFRHYWWGNDLDVGPVAGAAANTYYHVVASFDGTTRRIFLDGVLLGSDTPTTHTVSNVNFQVGSAGNAENWIGQLDEYVVLDIGVNAAGAAALRDNQLSDAQLCDLFGTAAATHWVVCSATDVGCC